MKFAMSARLPCIHLLLLFISCSPYLPLKTPFRLRNTATASSDSSHGF